MLGQAHAARQGEEQGLSYSKERECKAKTQVWPFWPGFLPLLPISPNATALPVSPQHLAPNRAIAAGLHARDNSKSKGQEETS